MGQVFHELHWPDHSSDHQLHCWDVWFGRDLPWNHKKALASSCLFSIVQSRTLVSPTEVLDQFFEMKATADSDP